MALKKFTNPKFLEQINRQRLTALLEQYQADFTEHGVALPDPTLDDDAYYAALAALAKGQSGLPSEFVETLYRIEAMANPHGKDRLLRGVEAAGVVIEEDQEVTYADYAVQVLLAAPELFVQKCDEAKIAAMTSFEYYGCPDAVDRSAIFPEPTEEDRGRIKTDIDAWLTEQREGDERVTQIDMLVLDGEYMFLIRRGDSFARLPTVEGDRILVRHLRPARDLVVGYSPQRDELRIHGKSNGENQAMRRIFGQRLFGEPEMFSVHKAFTLEPLREDGEDALQVEPGSGIDRIVLTELEVRTDDEHEAVLRWQAKDLFAYAQATGVPAIPNRGRLVAAAFQVHFTGQSKPSKVVVRAGNRLRLTRHCDAAAVHRWLTARGFRSPQDSPVNRIAARDGNNLERN
jgi:hypothetical protein